MKAIKTAGGLPEYCFASDYKDGSTVLIKRGGDGYYEIEGAESEIEPMVLNRELGISESQMMAMVIGAGFGWHVKGADPVYQEKSRKKGGK